MPTATTPDGRVWGYGLTGSDDGKLAIMHHGLLGDRRIDDTWCRLIEEAGYRFLSIERPGYGETPPQPMRCIAEWADLIAPLLESIDAPTRFDAVARSAGAPYAYALAAAFPDRVRRVSILSGVPFIQAPEVLACYESSHQAAYAAYAVQTDAELTRFFTSYCEELQSRFDDKLQIADGLTAIMSYGCMGPAREARLQAVDWGFTRSSITCPVDVWHSPSDDLVPFSAARLSATGLPNATFHIDRSSSHFSSREAVREMLALLKG